MAGISLPERGQPIDVPYLYTMATVINDLAAQIEDDSQKYTTVYPRNAQKQNMKTSDARFYASYFDLPQQLQVTAGETRSFSFDISGLGFKYAPIAVATPVNTGTSTASNDVTVTLTSITESSINGFVRFNSNGQVDIAVNVIAIGVPVGIPE